MEIYLKQGHTFPVPITVAEHLLGLASHDQLKVLLYILCHADEPLSASRIAQSCKVREDSVEEAVAFWQDANVLCGAPEQPAARLTEAPPVPSPAMPAQQAAPAPAPLSAAPAARLQSGSSNFAVMPGEIAERIRQNKTLAEMFQAVEQTVGRPLNPTESKSFFWMHEYLGLAPDVILMLAGFCNETDCFQVRYMEKIALEWQERGVMSHAAVAADIHRRQEARSFTRKLMKLFEMNRRPTAKQQEFFDRWQAAGTPLELIGRAYEITRNNKDDKLSLSYLNGILERWQKAGVRTLAEAEQADAAYYESVKAKKAAAPKTPGSLSNSSIDMSDVEKLMNPY